jgi:hypothetical protein
MSFGGRLYLNRRNRRNRLIKPEVYIGVLLFAAVAFLLPIYTATNFGTWEQYLSLLVAGILGNVVVDQGLLQVDHATKPRTPAN